MRQSGHRFIFNDNNIKFACFSPDYHFNVDLPVVFLYSITKFSKQFSAIKITLIINKNNMYFLVQMIFPNT
uniref:Uncharacterized protein n=1 Tax=Heterorhabditis bacteriophora TaxID=37862 RepID=A0A1I7X9V8_HETBA